MRIPPDSPSFIGPRETRSPSLFSVSSSCETLSGTTQPYRPRRLGRERSPARDFCRVVISFEIPCLGWAFPGQKLRGFGSSGGLQSSCKLSGKRSRLVCWTHGGDATCESWLSEYDLCDGLFFE
ncbi:hypothetical protein B296_00050204 [Ensete ventricosum]|uniref:Uncharacterized protein n=1 Tax=Ensete ventricosum TaxID=4639 RepID=A0A426XWR7_ENSVE|nr:hypothetical protein B296_00050204 [Ensete ventricosum]